MENLTGRRPAHSRRALTAAVTVVAVAVAASLDPWR